MYKAIVINPFDIFFSVERDNYFRSKAFDTKGANYLRTCLSNNTDKVFSLTGYKQCIERLKTERMEAHGTIIMASPFVRESFCVLLEHFGLPRGNVYTLSAAQGRRDITFRDICINFELEPQEIAFYSAFTQETEDAHRYGLDTYLFAPEWDGNYFRRGSETIAMVIRILDQIQF